MRSKRAHPSGAKLMPGAREMPARARCPSRAVRMPGVSQAGTKSGGQADLRAPIAVIPAARALSGNQVPAPSGRRDPGSGRAQGTPEDTKMQDNDSVGTTDQRRTNRRA